MTNVLGNKRVNFLQTTLGIRLKARHNGNKFYWGFSFVSLFLFYVVGLLFLAYFVFF